MCLALNMATIVKEGLSRAAIVETTYLIKKSRADVREEKLWGDEFPGHRKVKAAIPRHPAMLCQNQTSVCLPCQNGTAKNPQTRWRCNGSGAPPLAQRRVQTPVPTPPPPGLPPAPTGNVAIAELFEIITVPAGYMNSHTALP